MRLKQKKKKRRKSSCGKPQEAYRPCPSLTVPGEGGCPIQSQLGGGGGYPHPVATGGGGGKVPQSSPKWGSGGGSTPIQSQVGVPPSMVPPLSARWRYLHPDNRGIPPILIPYLNRKNTCQALNDYQNISSQGNMEVIPNDTRGLSTDPTILWGHFLQKESR